MKNLSLKYSALTGSFLGICTFIFDFGFEHGSLRKSIIGYLYLVFLLVLIIEISVKYIVKYNRHQKLRTWIIDILTWILYCLILVNTNFRKMTFIHFAETVNPGIILLIVFVFAMIRELQKLDLGIIYKSMNPPAIFSVSFASLIIIGTFLLLLPKATYSSISFTDSLFTSTSAVCVTGLIVVDTGTFFTPFGQSIIILLVQLGGIGIMTFTNFFAFFFKGGSSYQNIVLLGNITSESKFAEVINTIKKILLFTFLVEAAGFVLIYFSLKINMDLSHHEKIVFSLFHSISSFCNAGFTTLTYSLYDINFRFNYWLQLAMAFLIIIGGLGFPVIINLYSWFKWLVVSRVLRMSVKREFLHKVHVINLNTRLVLYTTLILILSGTLMLLVLEYNNTLSEHNGLGKLISAFFCAVTPRTAGFNNVDIASVNISTLFFIVLLMWIGASPASTGGGIKTSTFALAVLNIINLVKGKNEVELSRRQIPANSLRRSYAFIVLSIIIIGLVIFMLLLSEPDKEFSDIIFEAFSAFGTVGLSRGITSELSVAGRYIIVLAMFTGRVGALTIITSFFRRTTSKLYQYPQENILIN